MRVLKGTIWFPPVDPNLPLFLPSILGISFDTFFNFRFGMGRMTIWKYLLYLYSVRGVLAVFVMCIYMFPV